MSCAKAIDAKDEIAIDGFNIFVIVIDIEQLACVLRTNRTFFLSIKKGTIHLCRLLSFEHLIDGRLMSRVLYAS